MRNLRNIPHLRGFALIAAACLAGWSASARAQTITEYPIPTANSFPGSIAAGHDGNLWFTETDGNNIARITPSGEITEFPLPTADSQPMGITAGPDGNMWFAEFGGDKIGRIAPDGTITEFPPQGAVGGGASGITSGPDGNLWFTVPFGLPPKIGRITTSGTITEFEPGNFFPSDITQGPDGALWFTIANNGQRPGSLGRITTSGVVTQFTLPEAYGTTGITAGPDGALWFTDPAGGAVGSITTSGQNMELPALPFSTPDGIAVGRDGALWVADSRGDQILQITTTGVITGFPLGPGLTRFALRIVAGPDGALWFTESLNNNIGRIVPPANPGALVAAVLPSSRSATVGGAVSAFATMINTTGATAGGCAPVPMTPVPAGFTYQTTDPQTNALTGAPNTPATIAGGNGLATFVIGFSLTAPVVPTTVALGFDCTGLPAAASTSGLDTLLLSASSSPVPDIVALAASADPGILDLPGNTGAGAFAVATINVGGAGGTITVTPSASQASLPISLAICQTNPATGACLAPAAATASTTIDPGATPTFGIFASATGSVPFDPANNRVFVTFTDAAGTIRGSTSVAVRTQ